MTASKVALAAVIGLFAGTGLTFGQEPLKSPEGHVPLEKAIGRAGTTATPEVVPSLIVMNAAGASIEGGKLILTGVGASSIVFADRPVRAAGHAPTLSILEEWSGGEKDDFAADPPNATVSVFNKDGSAIRDAVVVLKTPTLEAESGGSRLTFDVEVLEGDLSGADGPASIFIDIIGRPLTPLSYAGVARRTAYRGAYYSRHYAGSVEAPYYSPVGIPCGMPYNAPCY